MALLPSNVASLPEHGVVVPECGPSGVATLPRLVSLPERSVVVTERAPSGVRFLQGGMVSSPSGVALSPERRVLLIVAAINNGVTRKRCFVGVDSTSIKGMTRRGNKSSWKVIMSGQGP